jgi:hypothetical protein
VENESLPSTLWSGMTLAQMELIMATETERRLMSVSRKLPDHSELKWLGESVYVSRLRNENATGYFVFGRSDFICQLLTPPANWLDN